MSKLKGPCGNFYLGNGIVRNPSNRHELMVDPDFVKQETQFKWYHLENDGANVIIKEPGGGDEICNHIHDGTYTTQLIFGGYEIYQYFGRDNLNRPRFYCLVPTEVNGKWKLKIKIAYVNTDADHYVSIAEYDVVSG